LLLERVNTPLLWGQWLYSLDGGDFFNEHITTYQTPYAH
jgi:hypothetical protein